MPIEYVDCVHCRSRHTARFLCDPARLLLDSMTERGRSYDMPTVAFDGPPLHDPSIGASGDLLIAQFVVQAALIEPTPGVRHPAVIFGGRSAEGVLPRWVHANSDKQLRASARLVHDMTELAISQAS